MMWFLGVFVLPELKLLNFPFSYGNYFVRRSFLFTVLIRLRGEGQMRETLSLLHTLSLSP